MLRKLRAKLTKLSNTTNMKYKIQMVNALRMWGDMKLQDGNGKYKTELFPSLKAAQNEIQEFCEDVGDSPDCYRAVREDKIQDVDYYN